MRQKTIMIYKIALVILMISLISASPSLKINLDATRATLQKDGQLRIQFICTGGDGQYQFLFSDLPYGWVDKRNSLIISSSQISRLSESTIFRMKVFDSSGVTVSQQISITMKNSYLRVQGQSEPVYGIITQQIPSKSNYRQAVNSIQLQTALNSQNRLNNVIKNKLQQIQQINRLIVQLKDILIRENNSIQNGQQRIQECLILIQDRRAQSRKSQKQINKLNIEQAGLKFNIKKIQQQITKEQEDISDGSQSIFSLKYQLSGKQSELKTQSIILQQCQRQNQQATQINMENEQNLKINLNRITKNQRQLNSLKNRLPTLKQQLKQKKYKILEYQQLLSTLRYQQKQLINEMDSIEDNIINKQSTIKQLTQQKRILQNNFSIQKTCTQFSLKYNLIEGQLKNLQRRFRQKSQQNEQNNKNKQNYQKKYQEITNQIKQVRQLRNKKLKQSKIIDSQLQQSVRQCQAVQYSSQEMRTKNQRLTNQLLRLQSQSATQTQQLEKLRADAEIANLAIEQIIQKSTKNQPLFSVQQNKQSENRQSLPTTQQINNRFTLDSFIPGITVFNQNNQNQVRNQFTLNQYLSQAQDNQLESQNQRTNLFFNSNFPLSNLVQPIQSTTNIRNNLQQNQEKLSSVPLSNGFTLGDFIQQQSNDGNSRFTLQNLALSSQIPQQVELSNPKFTLNDFGKTVQQPSSKIINRGNPSEFTVNSLVSSSLNNPYPPIQNIQGILGLVNNQFRLDSKQTPVTLKDDLGSKFSSLPLSTRQNILNKIGSNNNQCSIKNEPILEGTISQNIGSSTLTINANNGLIYRVLLNPCTRIATMSNENIPIQEDNQLFKEGKKIYFSGDQIYNLDNYRLLTGSVLVV